MTAVATTMNCDDGAIDYSTDEQNVVYGDDSRIEFYQASNTWKRNVHEFSAQMIRNSQLRAVPGGYNLSNASTLSQRQNLCSDERFADQPVQGHCSATLIDDDLMLTAGHCIERCSEGYSFVFGRYYSGAGQLSNFYFDDDVYGCSEVLVSRENSNGSPTTGTPDWAIVRLDRPVAPSHNPANIADSNEVLSLNTPLALVGYPSALPAKLDFGGRVQSLNTDIAFRGTVDAFAGNSGSGVFLHDGSLVGILTAGQTDYVFDSQSGCNRVNTLPQNTINAEIIHSANAAIEDYCNSHANPRLCDAPLPVEPPAPTPTNNTCVDPDGDGWGWDGTQSCRVGANNTPTVPTPTQMPINNACVDPDGDGWGWDGTQSCRVGANNNPTVPAPTPTPTNTACEDPDGDGWGWDGTQSCRVSS